MSKDAQITINMEEPLADATRRLAAKEGLSASAFCRRLVVQELTERGLLPQDLLVNIIAGGRSKLEI